MNEEEKEAIEHIKSELNINDFMSRLVFMRDDIECILNLIEKQQKEIEELKHDNSILCEIAYTGKRIQMPYTMVYTGTDNFISKDKIKEKIEEITSYAYTSAEERDCQDYAIQVLKELLGE